MSNPNKDPNGLETINDDCLRLIFMNLNIMDAVNLAATSTRLRNFAANDCFPKIARHIRIEKNSNGIILLTAPFDNDGCAMEIQSTAKLEFLFRYFGASVEDLRFKSVPFERLSPMQNCQVRRIFVIVMERCQYVKSLCFEDCSVTLDETRALLYGNKMFQNLKELNVLGSAEITNPVPTTLKGTLKVEILTFNVKNHVIRRFFEYYEDLTSLTIEFVCKTWRSNERTLIYGDIGNGLEHLQIMNSYNLRLVSELLSENKLSKLKSFTYKGRKEEIPMLLEQCYRRARTPSINYIMHAFSNNGAIEDLIFENGIFVMERNQQIFRLNRLKHFRLFSFTEPNSDILRALTRSDMPAIQSLDVDLMLYMSFEIRAIYDDVFMPELRELLEFVKSKITLGRIRLASQRENVHLPFAFFDYIINILKEPCTPERPFLHLEINSAFQIGEDEVSKIIIKWSFLIEKNIQRFVRYYSCLELCSFFIAKLVAILRFEC